jgi:hypothetical protein
MTTLEQDQLGKFQFNELSRVVQLTSGCRIYLTNAVSDFTVVVDDRHGDKDGMATTAELKERLSVDDSDAVIEAAEIIARSRPSPNDPHVVITNHGERFNVETLEYEW